jgi:8-oxo-dGTP pyrophosphatase MutT (NUDIX family)
VCDAGGMAIPQFIVDLRRRIGHDLLWLPGVTAVVVDDAGAVLLVRRSDNGQWAPVTGILEPGEEPAVCAVREVREETQVEAHAQRLVSVSPTEPVTHPNGDRAQYLDLTFRCAYVSGRAAVGDDESVEVGWFGAGDLPTMHPQARVRVDRALAGAAEAVFAH